MYGPSFGASVALAPGKLIVGAPTHAHYPSNGAAFIYLYDPMQGFLFHHEVLEVDAGGTRDRLGAAVAADSSHYVVTAPFEDGPVALSGATHVKTQGGSVYDLATEHSIAPASYEYFGSSVSLSGACHIVGAPDNVQPGSGPGAAYIFCNPGTPIYKVDFDILCCVQIPDFTTGPVEGEVVFENLGAAAPENVSYWVDLMRPGSVVESVVGATDTVVDPGALLLVEPSTEIMAGDPFGDYALVVHWIDGNGEHSEAIGFTVGPVVVLPVLGPLPLALLGSLLVLAGLYRMSIANAQACSGTTGRIGVPPQRIGGVKDDLWFQGVAVATLRLQNVMRRSSDA